MLDWTTGHLARNGSSTPRLDTEILLAQARDCRRIELYTHYNSELTAEQRQVMRDLVKRRAAAEPVAYLVGYREFFGLNFQVTPRTLIPRPDTETLVVELLDLVRNLPHPPQVLDLGTGSGCIAVTIATQQPSAQLVAVDICNEALEVARRNATVHDVADRIDCRAGDLFEPLESGRRFDIIVSNPPYVAHDELDHLPADVRNHEPLRALDGGGDGLDIVRRIVDAAPNYLAPNGTLLCEISPEQAQCVCQLVADNQNYLDPRIANDLAGQPRVIVAPSAD
ncbi:MAG: peptide chain release factor N(5)-glutamine methyltransferase [Planctomycetaceae bacterium]